MSRLVIIHLIVVTGLVGLAWLPITVADTVNGPRDDPTYIRRVFGEHTVGQSILTDHTISAMEIVARSHKPMTATLIASDQTGVERSRIAADLEPDDQWLRLPFHPALPAGQQIISIRTLPSIGDDEAILLRYQPQSSLYDGGTMVVDGAASYGDLGFRLLRRVPLWQAAVIWGQITDQSAVRGLSRIGWSVALTVLLVAVSFIVKRTVSTRWIIIGALAALAITAIVIRVPYLVSIEGIFGGDAFNYLTKAQALMQGENFFAADPRKGPLYSLLLLPGFATSDPLLWSRWLGITAAAGAIVLTTIMARFLLLPWGLALGAGLLLAVNQDFIWESPSGLANTLYTGLIMASIVVYLVATTRRRQWLLAVLLGLVFLTRYEGATFAAVLLPALWWRERLPWRRAVGLILLTSAIMLLPQISYVWSGVSGIRTMSDLRSDGGLAVAVSLNDYEQNLGRFHHFLRSVWVLPEQGTNVLPALIAGAVLGLGIYLIRRRWPETIAVGGLWLATVTIATAGLLVFTKSSAAREYLVMVPWFFTGAGLAAWLAARRANAAIVLIAVLLQAAAVTLILPKPRYYLPLIPFLSVGIVYGVHTLVGWRPTRAARAATLFSISVLIIYFSADGYRTLTGRVERYNAQAHHTNVMIQAAKFLGSQHGRIGFRTGPEPPIFIYVPSDRRFWYTERGDDDVVREELTWLLNNRIRYLVERPEESVWQSVREHPDLFEHLHTFDSIYGESRVMVYGADRDAVKAEFTK